MSPQVVFTALAPESDLKTANVAVNVDSLGLLGGPHAAEFPVLEFALALSFDDLQHLGLDFGHDLVTADVETSTTRIPGR